MGRAKSKFEYRCENPSCREVFLPSKELEGQIECPACKGWLKLVRRPIDEEGEKIQSMISPEWGSFERLKPSPNEAEIEKMVNRNNGHTSPESHILVCSSCNWEQVFDGPAPTKSCAMCPDCGDRLIVGQRHPSPPKEEPVRQDTLAQHYIQERAPTHGPDFPIAANFIQWLKEKMEYQVNWEHLMADQKESLHMIATKLGRILHGDHNHIDHWDDIAGYATLISNRLREDKASEALDTWGESS